MRHVILTAVATCVLAAALGAVLVASAAESPDANNAARASSVRRTATAISTKSLPDALKTAAEVDRLIEAELETSGVTPAKLTTDEDFLRRITFDLAGTLPSPKEVTLFGLDPNPDKRGDRIGALLDTDEFAENWSHYWSEVIYSHATDMRSRLGQQAFEDWLTDSIKRNRSWSAIVTDLLTATGDVRENGATALLFAHGGEPAEVAAEASRIFLGVQIQCANCHDHPTDRWKREQFHELAAFFPRVRVRPVRDETPRSFEVVSFDFDPQSRNRGGRNPLQNPEFLMRRFDRDQNGRLTKDEAENARGLSNIFGALLERGDSNQDGGLSIAEFKQLPPPQLPNNRGTTEYFMPDLNDPSSQGDRIDPEFFLSKGEPRAGLDDVERREWLSRAVTSRGNPWFAKAYVNRIWGELLGQGFYMPIDDLGPDRQPVYPEVLELLSDGFTAHSYDVKWLFRTIVNTQTYQRQIRSSDPAQPAPAFAAASPTRLRGDQIYNALVKVLGVSDLGGGRGGRGMMGGGAGYRGPVSGRRAFSLIFGFDPSTPQEDIIGNVPQALFMMNSTLVEGMVRAVGNTRLAAIVRDNPNDEDAISELYLLVLAREASEQEMKICTDYVSDSTSRTEAFEDLMWGLLNSSEFLTKR